jgi:hypothetical protein
LVIADCRLVIEKTMTGEAEPNDPGATPIPDDSGLSITNHQSPIANHTIRLGPPWEVVAEEGRTLHARNFGWPRTLDPGERVWLVCESVPGPAEVALNGTVVGTTVATGAFAAEITGHLRPRNKLVVAVASGEPLGQVALEIRPSTG